MSRYGNIQDPKCSAQDFKIDRFINDMGRISFGNSGVPKELQEYIKADRKAIEDIFACGDCLYILPKTRETAQYLFKVAMNGYVENSIDDNDTSYPLADEIEWIKLGDRYYLSLWWD